MISWVLLESFNRSQNDNLQYQTRHEALATNDPKSNSVFG